MDHKEFLSPQTILRPAPFWAINDRITPEESARQLTDMLRVGLSGGFFHSRHGLITDYLGEEWFECMSSVLQAAHEHDGYLWLYDEDLWPSGNAGGQVAGMRDEYRAALLEAEFVPFGEQPTPDGEDEPLAAYALYGRKGTAVERVERMAPQQAWERTECERIVFRRHYQSKTPWWGGESYSNLLHPGVTQEFLRRTHEVYREKLGDEFGGPEKGRRVPGIFTDEPHISHTSNSLPWWDGIPGVYAEWHGRDFWDDLPWMFLDGPGARKIRLLMHRTYLRQFLESFTKPIYEWCEANGLEHTGHFLWEDTLEAQIRCHCGGVMAHYRYQQSPGIDHLCRQVDQMLLTVKQVGSAARQLGRKRVLTEIFGVSRHTTTFEDFKWLGDFDLVLGANFLCPHLTLYSATGRRKRDYPPNWNYQQTYWDHLRPLNDYFTRVAHALTSGTAKPDVLILHPVESATAGHRLGFFPLRRPPQTENGTSSAGRSMPPDVPREDHSEAHALDTLLRRMLDATLNAGYDADLGDEGYLEDLGAVEGRMLRVGEMTYPVVVLPPSTTWRPRTYELLVEFVNSGGRLIVAGNPPEELDCEDARELWRELLGLDGVETVPAGRAQLQEALERAVIRSCSVRSEDGRPVPGLYVQHRVDGEQHIFFVVNSDRGRWHDLVLTLHGAAGTPVARWNPLDGSRTAAVTRQAGPDARHHFRLPPAGSALFVAGPREADGLGRPHNTHRVTEGQILALPAVWQYERSEPNVLVLDRVSVSLDAGQTWWDEDLEYRVRRRLAEHFGTMDALRWQPWVAIRKGVFDGKGGEVMLRYRFLSAIERPANAFLVIEHIERGEVAVNGQNVPADGTDWIWDRGFGRADIAGLIRQGENTVDFRFHYDFLSEVEPAYVVGDFGVRLATPERGEIIKERETLTNGSWITQGLPFYSGAVTYRTRFVTPDNAAHTILRLNRPSGVLFAVRVNGREAGQILWRPYELDITEFVRVGENTLEIEVVSSRQNTLGPLHEREGDDFPYASPEAFETDAICRESFSLFDYGLLGGAEILHC